MVTREVHAEEGGEKREEGRVRGTRMSTSMAILQGLQPFLLSQTFITITSPFALSKLQNNYSLRFYSHSDLSCTFKTTAPSRSTSIHDFSSTPLENVRTCCFSWPVTPIWLRFLFSGNGTVVTDFDLSDRCLQNRILFSLACSVLSTLLRNCLIFVEILQFLRR